MSIVWEEPQKPEEIIDELINKYDKTKFYCLLSGGKDSVSITHFISENYPEFFAGTVFANTGMATPITRKFVLEYCKEMNWNVEMTWATKTFHELVTKKGFPKGRMAHRIVMGYLKYHSWREFMVRKIREGEKACFISGVRKKESDLRNKITLYTKTPIDRNGIILFAKPFLYKNGSQLSEYHIINGLKKTPAHDWFDKSGECWCGCYYNDWDLKMLEKYDQFIFQTIKWLEEQVQLIGTKEAKKFPHWARSVGANYAELQNTLDQFVINDDYCGESCIVE